jgi:dTDP-4-dehydrorhamnose 3,5-epimerase-like enzyme
MSHASENRWRGLRPEAAEVLETRDYDVPELGERLATTGVQVGELFDKEKDLAGVWIPGIRLLPRKIYQQPHRGYFGEFAREEEGTLREIGMWPRQWASATMTAGSAKGFHIHPPFIPEGEQPAAWMRTLFIEEPENFALRPYDKEQWDAMFFVHGRLEMLLIDERAGMERRTMRLRIDGDNLPGPHNAGIIIPPGVAHALRSADSSDLIMVYGTSIRFNPEFEGRIESAIESAPLPPEWEAYFHDR